MTNASTGRPWWRQFGPGLLVAAAFIGPGTVTTATRAGAEFGYALLWTLVFAVAATIILQEMAVRLGLVARRDLATAVRESVPLPSARWLAVTLVLLAIGLGNAAYQTGNITGAAIGMSLLVGWSHSTCVVLIGSAVVGLLLFGATKGVLQTILITLVVLMSFAFLATAAAVVSHVDVPLDTALSFELPNGALLTAVALVGTTIVPYNLFLQASTVQEKWPPQVDARSALRAARWDTVLSVALGGIVTMSIAITAAAMFFQKQQIATPADMARQLEPLLGGMGERVFAWGMLSAGLTSAVTAPLAAGYAAAGSFNWRRFSAAQVTTAVAITVSLMGTIVAFFFGSSPQVTIVVAQAANGLLLPLVAVFLLVAMNQKPLLGGFRNGMLANALGFVVVVVTFGLGLRAIAALF